MTPVSSSPFVLTFAPWTVDGLRRIVASEPEWARLRDLDRSAAASGERPIVLVGCDVFEPWEGEYVGSDGSQMVILGPPRKEPGDLPGEWVYVKPILPAKTADVVSRLFAAIDARSHLTFVLPTRHPGRVEQVMPLPRYIDCDHPRQSCEDVGCTERIRPNLIILLDATTPAEVDAGFEDAARVPAAVHGLRLTVTKEMEGIDLCELMWPCCQRGENEGRSPCPLCLERGREFAPGDLDWLILRGETGPDARPCPLHVMRRLIEEARAAGVPVWVEGLGKIPYEPSEWVPNGRVRLRLNDPAGSDPAEWPEWARVREVPDIN